MALTQDLKAKHTQAMKNQWPLPKRVLGVVLGEISTIEARNDKPMSDTEVIDLIKKMIKDVGKSATAMSAHNRQDEPMYEDLLDEDDYLRTLLPTLPLTTGAIAQMLESQVEAIKAADEGKAMGIAIKFLKMKKVEFLSDDVRVVVDTLRGS